MLGTTGGRFLGPSGSQPHRNLWPLHSGRGLDFQTNGEGLYNYFFLCLFSIIPSGSMFMQHNIWHLKLLKNEKLSSHCCKCLLSDSLYNVLYLKKKASCRS